MRQAANAAGDGSADDAYRAITIAIMESFAAFLGGSLAVVVAPAQRRRASTLRR